MTSRASAQNEAFCVTPAASSTLMQSEGGGDRFEAAAHQAENEGIQSRASPISNQTNRKAQYKHSRDESLNDDSFFECNICLEQVVDPVITLCGHLYCWPCLYRWLNTNHTVCPVCKAGVNKENVIPVYGRGADQVDPRSKTGEQFCDGIPSRPSGQRPEPETSTQQPFGPFQSENSMFGFSFSTGFGFFPSLFGLQFTFGPQAQTGTVAGSFQNGPTHSQEELLSRLLFMLGGLVILCLLMF